MTPTINLGHGTSGDRTPARAPDSGGQAPLLAPRPASAGGFDEEVRVLLYGRMRVCHVAAAVFGLFLNAAILAGETERAAHGAGAAVGGAINGLLVVHGVVGWWFLRRHPAVSLVALRAVELLFFGVGLVVLSGAKVLALGGVAADSPDPRLAETGAKYAGLLSDLPFYFLILFYGVLVPNVRRRAVRVVAALSLPPVLTTAAVGASDPSIRPFVSDLLLTTAGGVLLFAVVSVFSCTRITGLQRTAYQARRDAERVGPYRLKKLIGEGGMGEVYLGEHRLLRRPCAVKLIRPSHAADPAVVARFAREVQAVTALSHPNTVRVYDYGQGEDGTFYYVMEYLDGQTLNAVVNRSGPLPPARAVALLRQVCGALAEAHHARLVHRDLKPMNLFVATLGGQPDVAKLLDFGLVRDLGAASAGGDLTQAGVVMGSPAYMSPEQAAGESTVDARADIYSLGAVAFFAVTGRPPFDHPSIGRLLAAHISQPPPRADAVHPAVPAALADVIAKCLAKRPDDRYQTATALGEALAGAIS